MSAAYSGLSKTSSPPKKRPKLSLKSKRKNSTMPAQQKLTPLFNKQQPNGAISKENIDSRSDDESKILNTDENKEESKEYVPPYTGLYNLGNTCYLNSVIQALRYCPEFNEGILEMGGDIDKYYSKQDENDKSETNGKDSQLPAHFHLVKKTKELLEHMLKSEKGYVAKPTVDTDLAVKPQQLLETLRDLNPMFQGYMQHDAQELLRCLLSHVQDASQELRKIEKESRKAKLQQQANGHNGNRLETVNEDGSLCEKLKIEQNGYTNGNGSASSCSTSVNGEVKTHKKSKKKRNKSKSPKKEKDNSVNMDSISYSSSLESPTNTMKSTKKKKRLGLGRIRQAFFGKSKSKNKDGLQNGDIANGEGSLSPNGRLVREAECQTADDDDDDDDDVPADKMEDVSINDVGKIYSNKLRSRSSSTSLSEIDSVVSMDTVRTIESDCMELGGSETEIDYKVQVVDIVDKLFQGSLVMRTRCLECECSTERREVFQDVSVPVQSDNGNNDEDDDGGSPRPPNLSLSWAISEFACKERLTGNNKYYCETCIRHTEAERTLHFEKLPQVFTVHLKRFTATVNGYYQTGTVSKVNNPIATPTELSLEQWCTVNCEDSQCKYQLFAVVMHSGVSSSSGHYITYIKHSAKDVSTRADHRSNGVNGDLKEVMTNGATVQEIWYQFDDEKVIEMSDEEFEQQMSPATTSTCTPYLLFYKKIGY
ncbi:ubiquitin carboxyl-terminal hydrolase 1-like [Saccoglossus kowalevskii]|uniref:Ubiquitin carboxyl-terminal hydrolase n=1 Tax=Saccoglossus kowalevskii TaxID=10224 RepID=A0ABM0GL21_SACKO|nr:PREDICTED: ubiquitin carboxyl-terminal hydrolase 1-like [Saccoglossus kowalevskii]